MRTLFLICVAAVFFNASCGAQEQTRQVDLAAERSALMDTDRAWSKTASDMEKSLTYWAEDAYFLPADAPLAQGDRGQVPDRVEETGRRTMEGCRRLL